eukprot:9908891-Alexandrium_andersonii.AAC.1
MSASLVGSEMCIRDSFIPSPRPTGGWRNAGGGEQHVSGAALASACRLCVAVALGHLEALRSAENKIKLGGGFFSETC